jgi:hypothetical protein
MSEKPVESPPQAILPKPTTIGLYVPTRGRSQLCMSSLNAWAQMCADAANVKFLIGVDGDDPDADKFIPVNSLEVLKFDESIITCGGRLKLMAESMDVDIYLAMNDKYFPLTQGWDNILRQIMTQTGAEIVAFTYIPAPNAFHTTACTKRWIELANKYEPTMFPFWFSDQWRIETHCYVFNRAPQIIPQLQVGGQQHNTQHMREMDFWWGLFTALRPRRLREAYEIYKGYGLTAPTFEEFVAARRGWIDDFMLVDIAKRKQLPGYEIMTGDKTLPGDKYMHSRIAADKMIAEQNLILWEAKI